MVVYKATPTRQGIFEGPKNLTGLFVHTGSFIIFAFSHGNLNGEAYKFSHGQGGFVNRSSKRTNLQLVESPHTRESGFLGLGSQITSQGIQNPSSTDKYWNTAPRIRNPQCWIQNPKLSWISLQEAESKIRPVPYEGRIHCIWSNVRGLGRSV